MKKLVLIFVLLAINILSAQSVTFSHVEKSVDNKDKIFYKINAEETSTTYLGEIEVVDNTQDYPKIFTQVYQKAKEIGANCFSISRTETIEGPARNFNPQHYYLKLYYTNPENIPTQENQLVLLNLSQKLQKIILNRQKLSLAPMSYHSQNLPTGEILEVSTRQLFGSSIKLSTQENQAIQYFQIIGARIRANQETNGGINFKTGDIVKLERSYAEFVLSYLSINNN